jgi:Tetratricopeptide repeat
LNNGAQRLGGLLSLFALAPLPWEMVEQCLADEDGEELEDCRDRLKHLHLVQRIDPGIYQLHPLIQQFFGAKLNNRADAAELRSAVAATAANIASAIPHLESVAAHHQAAIVDEDLFSLFSGLVRFYYGQGLYVQAEVWSKSCLAVTQEKLGDRHPAVAQSLNNLAALHSKTRFL